MKRRIVPDRTVISYKAVAEILGGCLVLLLSFAGHWLILDRVLGLDRDFVLIVLVSTAALIVPAAAYGFRLRWDQHYKALAPELNVTAAGRLLLVVLPVLAAVAGAFWLLWLGFQLAGAVLLLIVAILASPVLKRARRNVLRDMAEPSRAFKRRFRVLVTVLAIVPLGGLAVYFFVSGEPGAAFLALLMILTVSGTLFGLLRDLSTQHRQ